MFAIILTLVLSGFLRLFFILCIVACVYWLLLVSTILTGLMGMSAASLWFRTKMDSLTNRVKKVYNTIMRKG